MKIPKSIQQLLHNKYVLYLVLFLALVNILGYVMTRNSHAIIFFIVAGFIVSVFNRNMIIIIAVPLALTSILMVGHRFKEGLENAATPDTEGANLPNGGANLPNGGANLPNGGANLPNGGAKLPNGGADFGMCADEITQKTNSSGSNCPQAVTNSTLLPSSSVVDGSELPPTSENMTGMYKKNDNRIDYAATVEDAYDDLNKILGGDGIKRLTDDTQKLMGQQLQLAEAMKGMSPLLNQAKQLLSGFDLKNLDGLAGMAKNLLAGSK